MMGGNFSIFQSI
nr:unnamed protein product [Callosobruchus chinensis]